MSRISYIFSFRVLKCVLFAGLVLLIASGLERFFHRVSTAEVRFDAFYKVDRNSLDYVVLGNSHAYVSYDPVMVHNVLGVNGFVLGSGGQSIVKAYYDLVEVFEYHNPKVVFLEANVLFVPASKTLLHYRYQALDGMRWSLNKLQAGHMLLEPSQYVDGAIKLVRAHNRWKRPGEISENLRLIKKYSEWIPNQWMGFLPVYGYVSYDVASRPTRVKAHHYYAEKDNLSFLKMIRDICIANNAKLIVVKAPVLPAFRDMDQLIDGVRSACSDLDVEFADLHTDPKWRSEYRFFKDAQHVNRYGACVATKEMIDIISDCLGVSFKNEALDQQYALTMCCFVESIHLADLANGYSELSLKTAVSAGEEYAFYLIREGEKLKSQRYGPSPKFQFKINSDGSYKVQYFVRNPSGISEIGECLIDAIDGTVSISN